jgi:predicted phosphoribosyltransferase
MRRNVARPGIRCAVAPEPFHANGHWYEDILQTTDEEVRDLLTRGAQTARGV